MVQSTLDRVNSFNRGFEAGSIETTKKLVSTMYSDEEVKTLLISCKDRFGGSELQDFVSDSEVIDWFNAQKK